MLTMLFAWTIIIGIEGSQLQCGETCNDSDGDGYGYPASPACTFPDLDCDDADPGVNPGNGFDPILPVEEFTETTFEGFDVIQYIPGEPVGLVFLFHGSNGSARFARKLEVINVLNPLIELDYGFVATESTQRVKPKRWDPHDLDPTSNPDGDMDGDGWTIAAGDCNDEDPMIHPEAPDACDGKDNDCNGGADEGCEGGSFALVHFVEKPNTKATAVLDINGDGLEDVVTVNPGRYHVTISVHLPLAAAMLSVGHTARHLRHKDPPEQHGRQDRRVQPRRPFGPAEDGRPSAAARDPAAKVRRVHPLHPCSCKAVLVNPHREETITYHKGAVVPVDDVPLE